MNSKSMMARRAFQRVANEDFLFSFDGSIGLLQPMSDAASEWVTFNLPDDAPMFGMSFAIECRFIDPIMDGIREAGLTVGDMVA